MLNDAPEHRSFSARAVAVVAAGSGCLTWLCVGWFGGQGPLAAAMAVILVELFLASFGMIAILLAARVSDSYLELETRRPEQPRQENRLWLWRPIWQPSLRWEPREKLAQASVTRTDRYSTAVQSEFDRPGATDTLPISGPAPQSHPRDDVQRRKAA